MNKTFSNEQESFSQKNLAFEGHITKFLSMEVFSYTIWQSFQKLGVHMHSLQQIPYYVHANLRILTRCVVIHKVFLVL